VPIVKHDEQQPFFGPVHDVFALRAGCHLARVFDAHHFAVLDQVLQLQNLVW
jgi:hypothetical protein